MSRPVRCTIVFFLIALAITRSTVLSARDSFAAAQGDRERFVGAWRLAWLEEPGADGKVHRADCTGLFVFTGDGFASVQVMYPPHANEQLVGEALAPFRGQVVIATKFGWGTRRRRRGAVESSQQPARTHQARS